MAGPDPDPQGVTSAAWTAFAVFAVAMLLIFYFFWQPARDIPSNLPDAVKREAQTAPDLNGNARPVRPDAKGADPNTPHAR